MSILLQRVRTSGKCPPSLLSEDRVVNDDRFDDDILALIDTAGFSLRQEPGTVGDVVAAMKKVENLLSLPSSVAMGLRKKVLEYRRAVLLALVSGTSKDSPIITSLVSAGFLTIVKTWLDDTLGSELGSVDFLLHLLSSIIHLPVTKATIKDSGLGKAVGAVEKHRICKGTPNEMAICQRVQQIKEVWHARVKAQKLLDTSSEPIGSKRPADSTDLSPSASKKMKPASTVDDSKKVTTFSSLLKKVTASPPNSSNGSKGKSVGSKLSAVGTSTRASDGDGTSSIIKKSTEKKTARRVKWADHFGGKIYTSQDDEGDEPEPQHVTDPNVSWSDRKKRDRLREKELLSKAKKAKLMDEVDDDGMDLMKMIKPSVSWSIPAIFPDRPDVTRPQLESPELYKQSERMKTVTQIKYRYDSDVPDSPNPLSDAEQSLDMTSQGSAIVSSIPFFVPQVAPALVPISQTTAYHESTPAFAPTSGYTMSQQYDTGATAEFVQSLGLPMFLVGQSRNALQTLAGSPSLLSTLVDANGMYDQPRLMNLVQTLSASTGGIPPQNNIAPVAYQPSYSVPTPATSSIYGQTASTSRRIVDKSVEGNLHVSGFGPGTTEADLISSFSPYVRIDEIVMKGTFAFVNTSDPVAADRAKEALSGTLIGGMPVKISQATRKTKEPDASSIPPYASVQPSVRSNSLASYGNNMAPTIPLAPPSLAPLPPVAGAMPPGGMPGMPDVDSVRDDRGNPATKNLFIAGYGPSTTEQQLRDLVSQYVHVVGVILKGTFSFVNTMDRASAVYAREMLGGTMLNGGVVRINFAKETGRLGTSFDLTYGPNTGPNALRSSNAGPPPPPQTSMSYYGRGSGY